MKLIRFLLNLLSGLFPPVKLFEQKRWVYIKAGFLISSSVKITSRIKIYGGGGISLGEGTWLGIATEFYVPDNSFVSIGKKCDVAPKVLFMCGSHILGDEGRRAGDGCIGNIQVDDGVWIGTGAIILPNVYIGSGSVVAAGSVVVSGRYPANSLIAGNPAIVKKTYE